MRMPFQHPIEKGKVAIADTAEIEEKKSKMNERKGVYEIRSGDLVLFFELDMPWEGKTDRRELSILGYFLQFRIHCLSI